MKNMEKHIEELDLMLKNKGYDGYFLSGNGYPDKLKGSLTAFMEAYAKDQESGIRFPPSLTTYSLWRNEASDHIRCSFKLDYNEEKGFRIKSLEVQNFNHDGYPGKKATIPIQYCWDLPERQQANALVMDSKSIGDDTKRGLKF